MTREVETVPAAMTLHQAARFLADPARSHPSFPVVDEHGRAIGVIDPPSVIRWRKAGRHRSVPLGSLLTPERLKVAYVDEYLDRVADRLFSGVLHSGEADSGPVGNLEERAP